MKTLTEQQFVGWLKGHKLHVGDDYPESVWLTFAPDTGLSRFWKTPTAPEQRPYFLWHMLNLMGRWKSCFAWRSMGSWPPEPIPKQRIGDRVEHRILAGLGMPMGTPCIVEFERNEIDRLVTLLFATTVFGWSVNEDLYVVSGHAKYILKVSHHDVVHVWFRNRESMQKFIDRMAAEEFPLPTTLPDATFIRPEWMTP